MTAPLIATIDGDSITIYASPIADARELAAAVGALESASYGYHVVNTARSCIDRAIDALPYTDPEDT